MDKKIKALKKILKELFRKNKFTEELDRKKNYFNQNRVVKALKKNYLLISNHRNHPNQTKCWTVLEVHNYQVDQIFKIRSLMEKI